MKFSFFPELSPYPTRVERTGSREHIQVFYAHDASPEEVKSCKDAVSFKITLI